MLVAQCYFGLITNKLGGAGEPSDFLNDIGIWISSVLFARLILSTELVPAMPAHTNTPSGVMLPLRASVAPAGRLATPAPLRSSSVNILLMPAGSTAICAPLDPTRSWWAVNGPMPTLTKPLL